MPGRARPHRRCPRCETRGRPSNHRMEGKACVATLPPKKRGEQSNPAASAPVVAAVAARKKVDVKTAASTVSPVLGKGASVSSPVKVENREEAMETSK